MRRVLQALVISLAVSLATSQYDEYAGKLCDRRWESKQGICVPTDECDFKTNTLKDDRELPTDDEPSSCPAPHTCCLPKPKKKGLTVTPAEVPAWTVSFMVRKQKVSGNYKMKYIRNGVMINPKAVLTTGTAIAVVRKSILKYYTKGMAYVIVGDMNQSVTESDRKAHLVDKMITHKEYNNVTRENDIALAILHTAVKNVQQVTLPPPDFEFPNGTDCFYTGWGADKNRNHQSTLMITQVPALDEGTCSTIGRSAGLGLFYRIPESLVCAGGIPHQDVCTAGGGAPLVCAVGPNKYQLRGLLAYTPKCRNNYVKSMAVFCKVSNFITWIDENLENYV